MGEGSRIVGHRRLTGGVNSAVHRLSVNRHGTRTFVVLRQYPAGSVALRTAMEEEIANLTVVAGSGLPVPTILATDVAGAATGGVPSLLMTRLPGHVHLTPTEHRPWIERIAEFAAQLHAVDLPAPRFDRGPTPGSHRSDSSRYRPARETRRSGRPPSMPWSRHHPRIVPSSCTATTYPSTCCGRAARSPDSPTGTASTEGLAPSMSDNAGGTWPRSTHPVGQRNSAHVTSRPWVYLSTHGGTCTPYSTMTTTHQSRSRARLLVAAQST